MAKQCFIILAGGLLFRNCAGFECYNALDHGMKYRGNLSTTIGGRKCHKWDAYQSQEPTAIGKVLNLTEGLEENFCRNPNGSISPWCYVDDPDVKSERCIIPKCSEQECYTIGDFGRIYRGSTAVTASGKQCQRWDSQFPHRHNRTPENFWFAGLEHNFCRNPDGESSPWCYTMAIETRWEYCKIPKCPVHGCYFATDKGKSYKGNLRTSKSGLNCLEWAFVQSAENLDSIEILPNSSESTEMNYCRNPNNRDRPWCFISKLKEWEYCSVEMCRVEECYLTNDFGASYNGTISRTISGKQCLPWDDFDHFNERYQHDLKENFCRNPGAGVAPWCFTDVNTMSREYCAIPKCNVTCGRDEFSCADGSNCLKSFQFCDGFRHCKDGSDEIETPIDGVDGIMCQGRGSGRNRQCFLQKENLCVGKKNTICEGGIDECACSSDGRVSGIFGKNCFRCFSDPYIVLPLNAVCDKIFDCPDLSDEVFCSHNPQSGLFSLLDMSDEHTGVFTALSFLCQSFGMPNISVVLSIPRVCDGIADCLDGIDEMNCSYWNAEAGTHNCIYEEKKATLCDGKPECLLDVFNEECRCSNSPEFCKYVKKEYPANVSYFHCRDDTNILTGNLICNGFSDCSHGEDELDCPARFYCSSGVVEHIPLKNRCDSSKDCSDGSDESKTTCGSDLFYCENENIGLKKIDICDGDPRCASGEDECQPECIDSIFSDVHSMLKSKNILVAIAMISSIALTGNVCVAYILTRRIMVKRVSGKEINVHDILILSLAVSDFMVGIYTFVICVCSVVFEGRYCLVDRQWRSGFICTFLGVILSTGSEQSVMTMVLITISRLQIIRKSFVRLKIRFYVLAILLSWILSISVAVLPTLQTFQDFFIHSIWYGVENSFSFEVHRKNVRKTIKWLLLSSNRSQEDLSGKSNWNILSELISSGFADVTEIQKFGYYSRHTVCLPNLFVDKNDQSQSWGYSLIFVLFNLTAFVFMFVSYIVIYRMATKSNMARPDHVQKRMSEKMNNRITRILVTDFCCWVPVCILCLLQLADVRLSEDVYIPVGLILIPINSAMNPFLFTNIPDALWKKFKASIGHLTESINHEDT